MSTSMNKSPGMENQNESQNSKETLATEVTDVQKNTKLGVKGVALTVLLGVSAITSNAEAKVNMTEAELAKAREVALKIKPPVDFDLMLEEADRYGIECTGDLTRRIIISTCNNKVRSAQHKEATADNRKATADNRKATADNRKATADNRKAIAIMKKEIEEGVTQAANIATEILKKSQ